MSYTVWLEYGHCEACGRSDPINFTANHTSNCAPMWQKAGVDIAGFDGQKAGDCVVLLESVLSFMRNRPREYIPMEPSNGWGTYESTLRFLASLVLAFKDHPNAIVKVHR